MKIQELFEATKLKAPKPPKPPGKDATADEKREYKNALNRFRTATAKFSQQQAQAGADRTLADIQNMAKKNKLVTKVTESENDRTMVYIFVKPFKDPAWGFDEDLKYNGQRAKAMDELKDLLKFTRSVHRAYSLFQGTSVFYNSDQPSI